MWLLLLACAPPATQLAHSAPTSGGSWTVSIDPEPFPVGEAVVYLDVLDAAGRPATGVTVEVEVGMIDLGYLAEPEQAGRQPDGRYAFTTTFLEEGVWTLLGEVQASRGAAEDFQLLVEVR